jgi:UDP-N-acetyl-D-glucosamine dehydrogenase
LAGRRVLVLGVTYKPDVANIRRSAAVQVVELLRPLADVAYHDPYVPQLRLSDGTILRSVPLDRYHADLMLLLTRHAAVEHDRFARSGATVVDCATGEPTLIVATSVSSASGEETGHAC